MGSWQHLFPHPLPFSCRVPVIAMPVHIHLLRPRVLLWDSTPILALSSTPSRISCCKSLNTSRSPLDSSWPRDCSAPLDVMRLPLASFSSTTLHPGIALSGTKNTCHVHPAVIQHEMCGSRHWQQHMHYSCNRPEWALYAENKPTHGHGLVQIGATCDANSGSM